MASKGRTEGAAEPIAREICLGLRGSLVTLARQLRAWINAGCGLHLNIQLLGHRFPESAFLLPKAATVAALKERGIWFEIAATAFRLAPLARAAHARRRESADSDVFPVLDRCCVWFFERSPRRVALFGQRLYIRLNARRRRPRPRAWRPPAPSRFLSPLPSLCSHTSRPGLRSSRS